MKPDRRQGGAPLPLPDEGRGCWQQTTLYERAMNGLTDDWMSWFPSMPSYWALAPATVALAMALIVGIIGEWRFLVRRREDDGTDGFVRLLQRVYRCREDHFADHRFSLGTITTRERLLAHACEEIRERRYFHRQL